MPVCSIHQKDEALHHGRPDLSKTHAARGPFRPDLKPEWLQEAILALLKEISDGIPRRVVYAVTAISRLNVLTVLLRRAAVCENLADFEKQLAEITTRKPDADGLDYAFNYDLVTKWLSEEFRGKTLDILGVPTAPIVDVFFEEQADIPVRAGRLDAIFRDASHAHYHLEEQRNLTLDDLYRFAVYHFHLARKRPHLTDIILTSGSPWRGPNELKTMSGRYAPLIIDFTDRDGWRRLAEIKAAVAAGDLSNILELVFVPLYGPQKGLERSQLAESVLEYTLDLFKSSQLPERLVIATIVMSNKLVDGVRLRQLYERMKNMLDILEIAREDGESTGRQQMLLEALEFVGVTVPERVKKQIKRIDNQEALRELHKQIIKWRSLDAFEEALRRLAPPQSQPQGQSMAAG